MERNRLEKNTILHILQAADEGRYGVLAAVGYNLEQILGFVKAAERKKSPLIIQLLPWAITHSNGVLVHAAAQAARQASVPIAVHLYYCRDEDMVKQACELPFDSIMVAMSHPFKERTLSQTRELVMYCHAHGKVTTAEPRMVEDVVDHRSYSYDQCGAMKIAKGAKQFAEVGVDVLVLTVRKIRGGFTLKETALDVGRFCEDYGNIPNRRDSDSCLLQRIMIGMRKINTNKNILRGYYSLLEQKANRIPFTQVVDEAIEKVAEALAKDMDAVRSSGKA